LDISTSFGRPAFFIDGYFNWFPFPYNNLYPRISANKNSKVLLMKGLFSHGVTWKQKLCFLSVYLEVLHYFMPTTILFFLRSKEAAFRVFTTSQSLSSPNGY
jgi:hypothetical protein